MLADELGVSRVPVREALKALIAEGLVMPRPRTWAVVREFSPRDVADVLEIREAFERLAFRLAAIRCTSEGLDLLRGALDTELRAAERGDAVTARRSAADFHEIVVELADNHLLREVWELTRSRMRFLLGQHDDLMRVADEHADLYDAIARRDLDAVDRLSAAHLETSNELRLAHERAGPLPPASS